MATIQLLGALLPAIVIGAFIAVVAMLWRLGIEMLLEALASLSRLLPPLLRIPVLFALIIGGAWASTQFTPRTPAMTPASVVEQTLPSSTIFLPFVGH